jgi:hypothetical protein
MISKHAHFVVAVVLLAAGGQVLEAGKKRGWFIVIKKPLPIRKPLADMDQAAVAPWKVVEQGRLPADAEEEVGTREYLNWVVSEPGAGVRRPAIQFTAFYYTGVQDQVPHVGEECLFQAGMTQAGPKEVLRWQMPKLGETIEIGKVVFDDPRQLGVRLLNYYTICVNGEFRGDRTPVRIRMANPLDTHLYYCKVDVSIQVTANADVNALDAMARDMLDRGLAELVRSHWPRRGEERGGPKAPAKSAA